MSIGKSLAAARNERGLTLQQVSAATRIRLPILEAMEADDFAPCGGEFYARANIRNIAEALRIDPAPLLAEFDAVHAAPVQPVPRAVFEAETNSARRRRAPNWSAAMAVALVLVIFYGVAQALNTSSESSDPPVAEAPPTADATPTPSESTPDDDAVAAASDGVALRVTVEGGRSWVSVTGTGGKRLYEGEMVEGATRSFQDDEQIKIVVGNAGVVQLEVNGEDLGSAGDPGEVVRLTFRPGDPDSPQA